MQPADAGATDVARANSLAALFHEPAAAFARFEPVAAVAVPEPFRTLLDHASHMTVAMERFYGGPVGLVVAAVHDKSADDRGWYEREIILRDAVGRVVQHGIVRIDLGRVPAAAAGDIRGGRAPLGRILIAAGMLREVQRVGLLGVEIGPELRTFFVAEGAGPAPATQTFGRVAAIALDGEPAVELLEIVAPGPLPKVLR